jgi:hypothetical protein
MSGSRYAPDDELDLVRELALRSPADVGSLDVMDFSSSSSSSSSSSFSSSPGSGGSQSGHNRNRKRTAQHIEFASTEPASTEPASIEPATTTTTPLATQPIHWVPVPTLQVASGAGTPQISQTQRVGSGHGGVSSTTGTTGTETMPIHDGQPPAKRPAHTTTTKGTIEQVFHQRTHQ